MTRAGGERVRRRRSTLLRFSAWIACAVLGQLSALVLVDAGPAVRYHHYLLPWQIDGVARLLAVSFLIVQATAVVAAGRKTLHAAFAWLRDRFHAWQILLLVLAFVSVSAVPSRQPLTYASELLWAAAIQLVNLATVLLAVQALPRHVAGFAHLASRRLGSPGHSDSRDWFVVTLAIGVVLLAALLSLLIYQRHPHVPDEVVYLLHARYFAHGMLTMPAPPVPAAFDLDLMELAGGRWFSPVPPGWPAILSIGVMARAPWLVNPLLAGVSVLLAYALLRELYDRRTARLAVVLLAFSPWFLFLAMSFMTHTAALAFALLAALAVARLKRTHALRWSVIGGLAIGMVGLIRPLEGIIVAGLLGVWTLRVHAARYRYAPVLLLATSTAAAVSPILPYNRALTGDPFRFAINAYTDRHYGVGTNALGFGANRGLGWSGLDPYPGHHAQDVVVNAALNTSSLNFDLFGWGCGSLLLLFLFVLGWRMSRSDRLMLVGLIAVPAVHSLYWFSGGPDFGPRYWFLIILPLVALCARGADWLSTRHAGIARPHRYQVLAALIVLIGLNLTVFVPWRSLDKYHNYRGMRADVRSLRASPKLRNSVVLVRGQRHPDYASAAVYNPLDLTRGGPIFAWDRGPDVRTALQHAYPDRTVWIMDGPSVTGNGYRLTAGPLRWPTIDPSH